MDSSVRRAAREDLPEIVSALGQEWFFKDCLTRQDRGETALLVAWVAETPVGDVLLQYSPADEPEVREHMPGVPLLIHLEVAPRHQRRGTGTQLIVAAEALALETGHSRLALGVGVDNIEAIRLYERLGYSDWGHGMVRMSWEEPDAEGGTRPCTELGPFLVKDLTAYGA